MSVLGVFSRIWTEHGEILRISPYSVQMGENAEKNMSEYRHFSRSERVSHFETILSNALFKQSLIKGFLAGNSTSKKQMKQNMVYCWQIWKYCSDILNIVVGCCNTFSCVWKYLFINEIFNILHKLCEMIEHFKVVLYHIQQREKK